MLHLKSMLTLVRQLLRQQLVSAAGFEKVLTCLQAAQIWSISFSRLVQRAARNAAVLPGVGSTALPGAPEEERVGYNNISWTITVQAGQDESSNTRVIQLLHRSEGVQKNFVRCDNLLTFPHHPLSGCYLWGWQAESVP